MERKELSFEIVIFIYLKSNYVYKRKKGTDLPGKGDLIVLRVLYPRIG